MKSIRLFLLGVIAVFICVSLPNYTLAVEDDVGNYTYSIADNTQTDVVIDDQVTLSPRCDLILPMVGAEVTTNVELVSNDLNHTQLSIVGLLVTNYFHTQAQDYMSYDDQYSLRPCMNDAPHYLTLSGQKCILKCPNN